MSCCSMWWDAGRKRWPKNAVAIAWTLRQPAVTGAIVGFRNARQVDGLAAAGSLRLSADEIAHIDGLTAP